MVIRKITMISLIVMLLGLGIYEVIAVNKLLTTFENNVGHIVEIIDDYEDDVTQIYDLVDTERDRWEKNEPLLTLMFNHKDLSNICDTLSRLCTLVSLNNFEDSKVELLLLYHDSKELYDSMGFNIQNIL